MKHLKFVIALIILFCSINLSAQNARQDATGNYVAIQKISATDSVKRTGKTFTDYKDQCYDVYVNEKGKLFYTKISKIGKEYRVYLKLEENKN